jgi:hypothetical protein
MENINENYPLGGMLEPYDIERELKAIGNYMLQVGIIEQAISKEQQAEITEKMASDFKEYENE